MNIDYKPVWLQLRHQKALREFQMIQIFQWIGRKSWMLSHTHHLIAVHFLHLTVQYLVALGLRMLIKLAIIMISFLDKIVLLQIFSCQWQSSSELFQWFQTLIACMESYIFHFHRENHFYLLSQNLNHLIIRVLCFQYVLQRMGEYPFYVSSSGLHLQSIVKDNEV